MCVGGGGGGGGMNDDSAEILFQSFLQFVVVRLKSKMIDFNIKCLV